MKDVLKLWRKSNAFPLRLASASVTQGTGYIFSQLWIAGEQILIKPKLDKSLSGNILAWLLTEIDNLCIQLSFNLFSSLFPQRSVNFLQTQIVLNWFSTVSFILRGVLKIILRDFIAKWGHHSTHPMHNNICDTFFLFTLHPNVKSLQIFEVAPIGGATCHCLNWFFREFTWATEWILNPSSPRSLYLHP